MLGSLRRLQHHRKSAGRAPALHTARGGDELLFPPPSSSPRGSKSGFFLARRDLGSEVGVEATGGSRLQEAAACFCGALRSGAALEESPEFEQKQDPRASDGSRLENLE